MKIKIVQLIRRDFKRVFGARTVTILMLLAAVTIFFFFTSSGRRELVEQKQLNYMTVFLPQIIFGAWAVMSVYFDMISAEREHNVLDCILCSGTDKKMIFLAKGITIVVVSFLLAIIYLLPITVVIVVLSDFSMAMIVIRYLLPLWGYIMVYASLGILISILARSSKAALIWSLASGLILMPRFFLLIVDGVGSILHLSERIVEQISLICPGIMMEALGNSSEESSSVIALIEFMCSVILMLVIAYTVFRRQDEYNYGE